MKLFQAREQQNNEYWRLRGYEKAVIDMQDREQQLLTEIMGEAETLSEIVTVDKTSGFRPIEAVPVAVIKQRMVGTGSSQDADNAQGGRT